MQGETRTRRLLARGAAAQLRGGRGGGVRGRQAEPRDELAGRPAGLRRVS